MALAVTLWRVNLGGENILEGEANCISEIPVQTNPCPNGVAVQVMYVVSIDLGDWSLDHNFLPCIS